MMASILTFRTLSVVFVILWLVAGAILLRHLIVAAMPTDDEFEPGDVQRYAFFPVGFAANPRFHTTLPLPIRIEFHLLFVARGPFHLVPDLVYVPGGDVSRFFAELFNYVYSYRRVVSTRLLLALRDELVRIAGGDRLAVLRLNEAAIRVLYYRRKKPLAAAWAESLCLQNAEILMADLRLENVYDYSLKRLAIMHETAGRIDAALALCDYAIAHGITDHTKGGYKKRRERLLLKRTAPAERREEPR